MASRDLTTFREVTTQVADTGNSMALAVTNAIEDTARQSAEAKINKRLSEAGLELSAMQAQYQIDFEGDPTGGLKKFNADRKKLFERYGSDVSPLYKREWSQGILKLTQNNDAISQAWSIRQTKVNTVNFMNESIKNNFSQASIDGREFGQTDGAGLEAALNFGNSFDTLSGFGDNNLGSETTEEMLKTYQEDYLKSFLSGVAETNPRMAFDVISQEGVRENFSNSEQYSRMQRSFEIKAKRVDAAEIAQNKLNSLAAANELAGSIRGMGYAAQQIYFEENDIDPNVQVFYQEMSGYASVRKALTGDQKTLLKRKFNFLFSQTISGENMSEEDIKVLQEAVYDGMRKKVFTENEGFGFITQMLSPIIARKQQEISQFVAGNYNPFADNLGLDTLNDEIAQMTGFAAFQAIDLEPGHDETVAFMVSANTMYDFYLSSLKEQADARGITIAQLGELDYKIEKEVYNTALRAAKVGTIKDLYPGMAIVDDLPSTSVKPVFSGPQVGEIVNGYKFTGGDPANQESWIEVR